VNERAANVHTELFETINCDNQCSNVNNCKLSFRINSNCTLSLRLLEFLLLFVLNLLRLQRNSQRVSARNNN
jgi:hypothetical protein